MLLVTLGYSRIYTLFNLNKMPYFIYQIGHSAGAVVKNLSLVSSFEDYREAKSEIKNLRASANKMDTPEWKMVFAESELQAEELLQEKREAPVLMEWEK